MNLSHSFINIINILFSTALLACLFVCSVFQYQDVLNNLRYNNANYYCLCRYLASAAYGINISAQSSTTYSPFYLMYLRQPRGQGQLNATLTECPMQPVVETMQASDIDQVVSACTEIESIVRSKIAVAQNRQCEQYASRLKKGVKTFTFKVGDLILKRNVRKLSRKGDRLQSDWLGPYVIRDISDKGQVALQEPDNGRELTVRVNISQLKPYHDMQILADGQCVEPVEAISHCNGNCVCSTIEPLECDLVVTDNYVTADPNAVVSNECLDAVSDAGIHVIESTYCFPGNGVTGEANFCYDSIFTVNAPQVNEPTVFVIVGDDVMHATPSGYDTCTVDAVRLDGAAVDDVMFDSGNDHETETDMLNSGIACSQKQAMDCDITLDKNVYLFSALDVLCSIALKSDASSIPNGADVVVGSSVDCSEHPMTSGRSKLKPFRFMATHLGRWISIQDVQKVTVNDSTLTCEDLETLKDNNWLGTAVLSLNECYIK